MNKLSFKIGLIGAAVVGLLVIILVFSSITRIDPGYAGVVYNMNGGIEKTALNQGYHVVMPWKNVTEYPVSTETVYFSKSGKEGGDDDESINPGTADGKTVNMDVSYTYHYDPLKLEHVYTKFRGQSAETIANTYIRQFIKNALSQVSTQYGIFDIYGTKRSEVAAKTFEVLKDELIKDGIAIESFSIIEVRPDKDTMKGIQAKVNALQAKQTAQILADQAVIEAEKARAVARGEADAAFIRAQGEAKANNAKRASLTPELVQYTIAQKWDGKLPTVSGANTLITLPSTAKAK